MDFSTAFEFCRLFPSLHLHASDLFEGFFLMQTEDALFCLLWGVLDRNGACRGTYLPGVFLLGSAPLREALQVWRTSTDPWVGEGRTLSCMSDVRIGHRTAVVTRLMAATRALSSGS